MIIGSWDTRADWEAWHASDELEQSRKEMESIETETRAERWHEVLVDEHR